MRSIEKMEWGPFFKNVTKATKGSSAQVEVAGLDIGDQIEVDWAQFLGIDYDDKDDTLTVLVEGLEHSIHQPSDVEVDEAGGTVRMIAVRDHDGHTETIRLKRPLELAT